jgi:hypothetical protein
MHAQIDLYTHAIELTGTGSLGTPARPCSGTATFGWPARGRITDPGHQSVWVHADLATSYVDPPLYWFSLNWEIAFLG